MKHVSMSTLVKSNKDRKKRKNQHNYIQICEDLYYWKKSLTDGFAEDGSRRFYLEVEEHLERKRAVVDQYLQFYRNIYQRAWQDINDNAEVLRTILECIINLRDYEIRRYLAQEKSSHYWEFRDAKIVLKNCVGAERNISDVENIDELKKLMQPSANDPVTIPEDLADDEEDAGIDKIFGVGLSESREAYFTEQRDDARITTLFKMVNCNIVESNGRESVPIPVKGKLVACYVRYDSPAQEDGVVEENRYAYVYDYRHQQWVEIQLQNYRLI